MERPASPAVPGSPPAAGGHGRRKKEELAVLMSVVAAVVVVVQRFLTEHTLLLLPSQTLALQESVRATKLAVSKLQLMLAIASHLPEDAVNGETDEPRPAPASHPVTSLSTPSSWFDQFLSSSADDVAWRQHFRMTRGAFSSLLAAVRPALTGPAEAKLAAALYRMASGAGHRHVARRFGLADAATGAAGFHEVCKALQEQLSHLFDFPAAPEALDPIIEQFELLGLTNCCGAVGCSRFPVDPAGTDPAYYESPAGYPCVAMQGVTDAAGRFLDISVGWGGSMLPAHILPGTRLFARVEESHELLHGRHVELLTGTPVPEYIIGDGAYPLLPWLITPYPATLALPLSPAQQLFNGVHERARASVSRAFHMLKSYWSLLATGELRVEDVSCTVAAACILHNFLIDGGEPLSAEQEPLDGDDAHPPYTSYHHSYHHPHHHHYHHPHHHHYHPYQFDPYAASIRDALASHISAVSRLHMHLP